MLLLIWKVVRFLWIVKLEGKNFVHYGNGDLFGKIVNIDHSDLSHFTIIATSESADPGHFYIQYNVIWNDYPQYFFQIIQIMPSDGDLDNDGVVDQDDDCDFQQGTPEYNGCPS